MECSVLVAIQMALRLESLLVWLLGMCCVLTLVLSKVGGLMLWLESELSLQLQIVKNAPCATECQWPQFRGISYIGCCGAAILE